MTLSVELPLPQPPVVSPADLSLSQAPDAQCRTFQQPPLAHYHLPSRITPPHPPLQVGHLSRLQRLSCSGNSELILPASMTRLTALRCLDLCWTRSNVAEVFELGVDRFQVRSLLEGGDEAERKGRLPPHLCVGPWMS